MSNVIINKQKIDVLANAISAKSGEPVTMTLDEMVEAVDGIETNPPPTLQTKSVTYTPSTSAVTGIVTADRGYDGLEEVDVTVSAVPRADWEGTLINQNNYRTTGGNRYWSPSVGTVIFREGWMSEGTHTDRINILAVPSNTTVTPSKTAQTVGGANYMMEGPVTVSAVPMADAGPAWGTETFITESGVRKFRYEYEAYAESEGWVDEGGLGDPTWVEWTAVPSNTTVTPTESAQTVGGAKQMMEGPVTVSAIPSSYVGSGVTRRSFTDLSASGATVTAPAGYYESGATKTVASGTEGTPTATKGTVANNSVTVTPSVTNAAGYIPGGTHTGTAVTVTASELVSGSQTITTNGTYDVTNLASIVAAIESGGGGIIREPIVPQTTVTGVVGDWVRLTSGSTPSIVDGEFYSYTINGTEYLATGTTNNGIVYLSDILWDWSISGEAIGYDIQYGGIWLNASVAGTYTVKVDKITLANSGLKTQVIFPEQSVTATTPDSTGYTANINVSEVLIEGKNYIVTMDGTSYLCYAHAKYGGTDIYLGDDNVIWGNASQAQYPFCCATWGNGTTAWGVANTSAHTVKIEKVLSFDSAELGTKTITANGTYSASSDDLDGYSSITVNVEGGSTRTTIVPEQTINASTAYTALQFNAPLVNGEQYIVTVNGETKALTASTSGQSVYMTFASALYIDYTAPQMYLTLDSSSLYGTYTVKVEQESGGGGSVNLQTKSVTYTPTTSQQTATVTADSGYDGLDEVNVTVNAIPSQYVVPTGNKAITANGTNIDVAQYATVSVTVSGGSVNVGTVTTTNSSNQNTSISFTLPSGRTPKAFFCRLTSQIARSSGSRYYYVYDMRWDGSANGGVAGNTFYMSSGTLTNVTSGYSYSQSNTTFTLSSTGSRSTSPGSFYNGTYELVYVY